MTSIDFHARPRLAGLDEDADGRFTASPQASWWPVAKGAVDFALALVMFALAWPVILLVMALVKLTSRGPALYRQVRLGLDGREFTLYKIRTMGHDCERLTGPRWAARNDPRVTPLGRFLRKTHLDELPQLWNVLRGEMSLVGPRPERPEFVAQLERAIPQYRDRLQVRPGVTGLAQILLPADSDFEGVRRKVACDLCYVQQMGPWLDLRILVGTALKILGTSFRWNGRLLRLPNDWDASAPRAALLAEEPVSQLQTA